MPVTQNSHRDIQLPGLSPLDEASRALLNLCWIAGCLVGIAAREADNVYDDWLAEDPDVRPPGEPTFLPHRELATRQHMEQVRDWWPLWTAAIPRAMAALNAVKWRSIHMSPERAFQIVTEWRTTFPEPLIMHPSEQPGDHLFRSGGALRAHRGVGANLDLKHTAESIREMEQIAQRLRLLGDVHVPDDLRNSVWYSKATNGGLNSSMLRDAQANGRFPSAVKPSTRWLFPISEVIREFPEYRSQIQAAETTVES